MTDVISSILAINPDAECQVSDENIDSIIWKEGTTQIAKEDILAKQVELQVEYDAQEYARNRQAEYPSIADLVVALYDTDDKADIEAKRAAVKAKFPKP